jgi:hypothetical protein
MKWSERIVLLLVTIITCTLTACSSGGSAYNQINCSRGEDLCITIKPVEPVYFADPVTVTIKVTNSKDVSDLHATLHTSAAVTVDGPNNWENNLSNTSIKPGYADWNFSIKGGQTLTFTRVLHFQVSEGYSTVSAEVVNVGRTLVATDYFIVHTAHDGKYYKEGTPIPRYTPDVTMPAYGPGTLPPTFLSATLPWMNNATPLPAAMTPVPPPGMYPTPIQSVPLVATSTPRPSPYPGPSMIP